MIKFRVFKEDDVIWTKEKGKILLNYDVDMFYTILNGNILDDGKYPPFRDKESLRVINEIDHAEIVENEWYAMVTPFGKTCLSALSDSSKYALALIYNSRRGKYTTFQALGSNAWKLLANLDIELLIGITEKIPRPYYIDYIVEKYYEDENGQSMDTMLHKDKIGESYIKDGIIHAENYEDYIAEFKFEDDLDE